MNTNVNTTLSGGLADIRNIAQCYQAIKRTLERNPLLPGICAFCGPSGFGKSTSACYVANKTNAYYVQVRSTDTRKSFLQAVLRAMSIPRKDLNLAEMMELASTELAKTGRPLIIDEFDHLVVGKKVEVVRDLYEGSQGTILIIGEEMLPLKLEKWERFHNRILNWIPALPADLNDVMALTAIYAPMLSIERPVLEILLAEVRGSTRRVSNNLEMLNEVALENGIKDIDLKAFKALLPNGFVTGESPKPRSF